VILRIDAVGGAHLPRERELPGIGVDADDARRAGLRAPWITASPMPPRPNTATLSPRCTFAVLCTAPMPVVTPQPSRQTFSSGAAGSIFASETSAHDRVFAEGAGAHVVEHRLAFNEKRDVPSGITPLPCVARTAWHRLVLPDRQNLHLRHSAVYSGMTWSPGLTLVTPSPTSTTMPPPSWPSTAGNRPSGSSPLSVNASVWHTPVCVMRTSTSPARGGATSISTTCSGWPGAKATAARDFMAAGNRFPAGQPIGADQRVELLVEVDKDLLKTEFEVERIRLLPR
jgi:hypothetical protein